MYFSKNETSINKRTLASVVGVMESFEAPSKQCTCILFKGNLLGLIGMIYFLNQSDGSVAQNFKLSSNRCSNYIFNAFFS